MTDSPAAPAAPAGPAGIPGLVRPTRSTLHAVLNARPAGWTRTFGTRGGDLKLAAAGDHVGTLLVEDTVQLLVHDHDDDRALVELTPAEAVELATELLQLALLARGVDIAGGPA